jgi:hypothetical protein
MNALVFFGCWFGFSLVAGVGVGRFLGRIRPATVPAEGVGPPAHRGAAMSCGANNTVMQFPAVR